MLWVCGIIHTRYTYYIFSADVFSKHHNKTNKQ